MNKRLFMAMAGLMLWLTGCGVLPAEGGTADRGCAGFSAGADAVGNAGAEAEAAEGDFLYRLVTEKSEYAEGESLSMYATLEYVGDKKAVTIYHAASPFAFGIVERTRDFDVPYAMALPLLSTTLTKGEPLCQAYQGSGGYSGDDPEDYIAFMKRVMNGDFPVGTYDVVGSADFYVETKGGEKTDYRLTGEVRFEVTE